MFKMWEEILLDVIQGEIHLVQFVVALITVPEQPVFEVEMFPPALDDQADGSRMPDGGMGGLGRVQVHVAWPQGKCFFHPCILDVDLDRSFELIEQLFGFIVMVIFSGIGPTNNHHDVITGFGI